MIEITEDYVSFEIAKLLKYKGFDSDEVGCLGGFYSERCYESGYGIKTQSGQEVGIVYDDLTNSDLEYDEYLRPTIQMAMKWLREVKNYYIQVMLDSWACGGHLGYYVVIQKTDSDFEMMLQDAVDEVFYQTYEEACEAAIKYCLENLV